MTKIKNIFINEDGFTTLSVVVSLLLTLSLIFSTAQVYRITSASADIQSVADSSVQAAENQVAEFMILVRVADSVVLSLSLSAIVTASLGVVALCTPVTAEASDILLDASKKMFEARDNFANKSSEALNNLQKALPFLASVKAYQVAEANNGGTFDANYLSIAILMPGEGIEIKPGNIDDAKSVLEEVENNSDDIKKAAAEAEEAAKKANESKVRAFMADCGNNPNYCMYERARNKAYMTGADNPLYNSPDTWSFSVALKRTQAYYPKRIEIEAPEGPSIDDQANSALRRVFYTYASQQLSKAYVEDTGDSFKANFPHLPKNTDEMKTTTMYTEVTFPISSGNCMHAYSGCPGCAGISGYGTLLQLDSGGFSTCPYCKFTSSSLGSVAAASTSISNGFEYHYKIVEEASKDYQKAKEDAEPLNKKVKSFAEGIFEQFKNLIKDIFNKRIYSKPPGAYGALCLSVNTNSSPASKGFESTFVSNDSILGIRAAISAATLIEEESEEGKTILNSVFDGFSDELPTMSGVIGIALNSWSSILKVYSEGQDAFLESLESSLNQLPVISASGLGTWASKRLPEMMSDLGFEPANLNALKPVLINSTYVSNAESEEEPLTNVGVASKTFASKFLVIKDSALKFNEATNSLLSGISGGAELAAVLGLKDILYDGGTIELATIQPLGSFGPSIPISIKLPEFATSTMQNIVSSIAGALQSILGNLWGGKIWR